MGVQGSVLASWADAPQDRRLSSSCSEPRRTASVEERVAVFDNDGTLWCEKPMPIQADFILRRLVEMAEADPDAA